MRLRILLELIATKIKKAPYRLDPNVPLSALIGLAYLRLTNAIRGSITFRRRLGSVFLGSSATIRNKSFISLGEGVTLGRGVQIDGMSKKGVAIGNGVNIGPFSIIQASGVMTRMGTGCSIGANSGIGAYSFIGAGGGVDIGANVIMGQYVSFHSENHIFSSLDIPIRLQGVTRSGIIVEDDCWVGAKVTFLDGCRVGSGSVIAAGTVVRGNIPPLSVVAGVPGRVIRTRKSTSLTVDPVKS